MKNLKGAESYILGILKTELPKDLHYHGLHHTLDVLRSAQMIARDEKISDEEMELLKIAVWYHDAGFTKAYKNHEDVGCDMARESLPRFGFTSEEIEIICGMIQATRIPQQPHTQLEKIIADADLEYLGTDNFESIGRTLFEEIKIYLGLEGEKQWNIIQMNFLRSHHYFTEFCRKNREAAKQKHLEKVIKLVEAS